MSDGERKVRVRGGPKGVRHITLDEWKREIAEREGKLKPQQSHRQQRAEAKRKRKRS